MTSSKVLVLGAGASLAYGYPLGKGLRSGILEIGESEAEDLGIRSTWDARTGRSDFSIFKDAFRNSQMYSIDAFLGRRKEFSDIGKKCIAHILLKSEKHLRLLSEHDDKDHWYQYLLNYFTRKDWDDLNFEDISVVTFNYDRSLEHYLHFTLQSAYDKSPDEVTEKLRMLRIVHVYGSLCKSLPGERHYLSYDGKSNARKIVSASAGLVVIPEGRNDSQTLVTARQWLNDANSICFLGFGFDDLNVERLAEGEACYRWKQGDRGKILRSIVGTCIGMTDAEVKSAVSKLSGESYSFNDGSFHRANCTQVLRETRFLS